MMGPCEHGNKRLDYVKYANLTKSVTLRLSTVTLLDGFN
jgi:hypothetical protein